MREFRLPSSVSNTLSSANTSRADELETYTSITGSSVPNNASKRQDDDANLEPSPCRPKPGDAKCYPLFSPLFGLHTHMPAPWETLLERLSRENDTTHGHQRFGGRQGHDERFGQELYTTQEADATPAAPTTPSFSLCPKTRFGRSTPGMLMAHVRSITPCRGCGGRLAVSRCRSGRFEQKRSLAHGVVWERLRLVLAAPTDAGGTSKTMLPPRCRLIEGFYVVSPPT